MAAQGVDGLSDPRTPPPTDGRSRAGRRHPRWAVPAGVALAVLLTVAAAAELNALHQLSSGHPGQAATQTPTVGPPPTRSVFGQLGQVPHGSERLLSPRTIGPLTLQYASPPAGTLNGAFGYRIHDKTGTVYLLYSDPEHVTQQVNILAVTGTVEDYKTVLDAYLIGVKPGSVVEVNPGQLSGVARCGVLPDSNDMFISCAWADPGSIGLVYCYYRTLHECTDLFPHIRDAILTRS